MIYLATIVFSLLYLVLALQICSPVGHVSLRHSAIWWMWRIKNRKIVSLKLSDNQRFEIQRKFDIISLIDIREKLLKEHEAMVYYAGRNLELTITFSSPGAMSMFLLRYL